MWVFLSTLIQIVKDSATVNSFISTPPRRGERRRPHYRAFAFRRRQMFRPDKYNVTGPNRSIVTHSVTK
jgi:hypothetical protein